MMTRQQLTCATPNADDATALGRALAPYLRERDVLLLDGPVGAGKTHFARAVIQTILEVPEDVPSPSFTLVQTYDTTAGPLWHCDLYRLTSFDLDELGLNDAFETAITLIEWPDRAGEHLPTWRLDLRIEMVGENRTARLEPKGEDWQTRLHEL